MAAIPQATLHILLIEDDEDDVLITRDLLSEGLEVAWSLDWKRHFTDGLAALSDNDYDVALVDLRLGPDSGIDLIQAARGQGSRTPAILLTGQGDTELDLHAVELGAADYLVKGDVDGLGMARSIHYAVERAQHRAQLEVSEARYRFLFDANPEPLCLVDAESNAIIALNAAGAELYGSSLPDLEQQPFSALVADDQSPLTSDPALSGFCPKSGTRLEIHRRQDGSPFYVEITEHSVVLDQGPAHLLMLTDVSPRIEASRKARESEEAYLKLLTDLRDAVVVIDQNRSVLFANKSAHALFHTTRAEDIRLPGQLPAPDEPAPTILNLGEEAGVSKWTDIQTSRTQWNGVSASIVTLRDMTDRIKNQERMRLLTRSIESSSNGIVIAEAGPRNNPIIYVNPAFEAITGYTQDEVEGRDCRLLQGPDTEPEKVAEIRKALDSRQEIRLVLRNYRKDGTPFWNDLYVAPVTDESGEIRHFIGVQSDISAHRDAESTIAYNASHDVLTGLPNRSLLADRMEQGLQFAERHKRTLAVVSINMDGFKLINDSLGHPVGDRVLVEVGKRLSQLTRAGDTVARLGSDEFVVLLPDLALPSDVVGIVEKILARLAQPYQVQDHNLHLTASAGIASSQKNRDDPMALVQQADMAMIQAKRKGMNTYQWYTSDLNDEANKRVTLRNELEKAIDLGQLILHYQPEVDSRTGKIVSSEALIRWQHPEQGLVAPGQFIPLAEETGQIIRIGHWVLEQACTDNKRLMDNGHTQHAVSVNASPLQLQQDNFAASVQAVLEKTGLPADQLEIEITESVLIGDKQRVIDTLNELSSMGVKVTIDDFGTGFSSLSYIKMLPASKLKIDRAFIKDVISDSQDAAITLGVISMSHHLGLAVVAEGVETEAHANFLRRNECDLLQGYHLSYPVPIDELESLLQLSGKSVQPPRDAEPERTLLILDDEQNIIRALTRLLRRDGYRILSTTNAREAFALLAENDVQVIISDQRMPEMSGTEFLSEVKDIYPNTIRIVLSGYTDLKSITDAINEGAIYKFLTKPWDDEQIRSNIRQAFRHHAAEQHAEEFQ
ncbi:EAL domain-containing protein [Marinobacter halodurans]|uniref:EAL domain-containing protein n=1 Tax=Marinobacter halodurans TaxID=2528979 RepID=A0ABY1ZF37_9GAMM|nr:EAL domain-containing protein [Marinobacter halodurans]TBW49237.1 EAL domain-containing protein [Marinobacter halodurans]